ncbi:MAG TPA: adenylate/guanylate cyclase domain-containing protein [Burkholderiales bacterium]|nr:adenylate/guanylate cyclase domain-containing protein [Burkholderiales bacterium]
MTLQQFRIALNRRNLRLASGLVLFTYVATHLGSHAFGLASLASAEAARLWFVGFWRSALISPLLYAAFITHITLACVALYERRTLRMPALEAARLVLGFSVPFLLAGHYTSTQIAHVLYHQDDPYIRIAWMLWLRDQALWPIAFTTAAWTHGCLGIHLVLRRSAAYRRRFHLYFAFACVMPVLALGGFLSMAHEIGLRMDDPHWYAAQMAQINILTPAQKQMLEWLPRAVTASFALLFAGVLAARAWRAASERRAGRSIEFAYPTTTVQVPRGWSVLEASRANRIPHLSLCGGRARCSTCRVRVDGALAHCPPPNAIEQRTLQRIGAPPGVRLACQLRPTGNLRVTPMLPMLAPESRRRSQFGAQLGSERDLVVLFIDLRRWTGLSQQHLPFDLVYVLEQYFEAVGDAVLEAGGTPNQFIGDSVMAIFGLETDHARACKQALAAARGIAARLKVLGARLQAEFGQAIDFGIGIHAGRAAVGAVGYHDIRTLTAVGDAVNTASRLQELTKTFAVRLVISAPVAQGAGLDTAGLSAQDMEIRGRTGLLRIYAIGSPEELPASA